MTPDNREAIARIKEREELIDIVARFMPRHEPTSSTLNLVNAILATRSDRFAEGVEWCKEAAVAAISRDLGATDSRGNSMPPRWGDYVHAIRSLKAPEAGG